MIKLEHVDYVYADRGSHALKNVSLEIKKGEFLAIVGHNGSGKSTLAKLLNGLYTPTTGTVTVAGLTTAAEENLLPIRQQVGMVFQNPDNQLVTTVVEEDVAFGPENIGVPSEEIRKRVHAALAAVGMTEYATRAPHMLSGGQKQRIAIAGMLAMQPKVLVLDEATAMLDPEGRREILAAVHKLNQEQGITVVMITQYMEEATGANRVVVMADGEILTCGTPQTVFSQGELLRSKRLDVPAMVDLAERLTSAGCVLPKNLLTVEAMTEALCQLL